MVKESELTKEYYKSGELAKMIGVQTRTVQTYCLKGEIQSIIMPNSKRIISREEVVKYLEKSGLLYHDSFKQDVIYARVSTHKQKESGDLGRQIDYITKEVVKMNPKDVIIYQEVGSGLNDNRKELNKILKLVMQNKIDRIFILYKDRLTRFGFNYIETICNHFNTKIVVLSKEKEDKSIQEELAEDIISIIHSFSSKLYGMRKKVKEEIEKKL